MCPQSADLAAIVNKKLESLSVMSFNEIALLPAVGEEELLLKGKKYVLGVWHDTVQKDEHRITVQLVERGILSVRRVCIDGFVVNLRDEKRPLSETDLAAFD